MKIFRPDIDCTYDADLNPWRICYYPGVCDDTQFADAKLTFEFGTYATFGLPINQLQINYEDDVGDPYCGVGIQELKKMPFDQQTERHFYFGDVFFKSFVGVFDSENNMMGLAKSSRAASTVELICPAETCQTPEPGPDPGPDPEPIPDPPEPDPTPDPTPGTEDDNHLMWLWIVTGLAVFFILVLLIVLYYCRQKQRSELNAIIYQTGHSGDMIEKDLSGKGDARTSQFADHQDIMRETFTG